MVFNLGWPRIVMACAYCRNLLQGIPRCDCQLHGAAMDCQEGMDLESSWKLTQQSGGKPLFVAAGVLGNRSRASNCWAPSMWQTVWQRFHSQLHKEAFIHHKSEDKKTQKNGRAAIQPEGLWMTKCICFFQVCHTNLENVLPMLLAVTVQCSLPVGIMDGITVLTWLLFSGISCTRKQCLPAHPSPSTPRGSTGRRWLYFSAVRVPKEVFFCWILCFYTWLMSS